MQTGYLQIEKIVELAGVGDPLGNNVAIVDLASGSPYTNLCMWASGSVVTVTAQPLIGTINDGGATALTGVIATKVLQTPVGEVRPATTGLPDGFLPIKSALKLTNTNAAPTKLTVYMTAATTL